MTTVFATHTGKTMMEITAIQITLDYLTDIRPEKPILPLETIFIDLLKCFEMIFNTPIVWRSLRIARPINTGTIRHCLR